MVVGCCGVLPRVHRTSGLVAFESGALRVKVLIGHGTCQSSPI